MIKYCYSEDLPGIPFTSILLLPLVILIMKRSLRMFMYFSGKSKWSFYMFHRVSQSVYNIWLKIRCILNSFKHVRAIQGDEVLPTQTSGDCVLKIVALDLLESVFHGHLCDSWGFSFFLSFFFFFFFFFFLFFFLFFFYFLFFIFYFFFEVVVVGKVIPLSSSKKVFHL